MPSAFCIITRVYIKLFYESKWNSEHFNLFRNYFLHSVPLNHIYVVNAFVSSIKYNWRCYLTFLKIYNHYYCRRMYVLTSVCAHPLRSILLIAERAKGPTTLHAALANWFGCRNWSRILEPGVSETGCS